MKELTQKEIQQVKEDLARKGVELKTIEYLTKTYKSERTGEPYEAVYMIANGNYYISLMNGNNRWYEKRYTTKKVTKKYADILRENAKIEIVEVSA